MTQNSLTKGNRAIRLFTDRNQFVRLFAGYLNDDPPREKILFFHGDGGNGKSLLLKYLGEKCCKRFYAEIWRELESIQEDAAFASEIEKAGKEDYKPVPLSFIDFERPPMGEDDTKNHFYGLLRLRKKIAKSASDSGYQMQFPLYDFACVWYLHNEGKSSEDIRRLFPLSEIAGLIAPAVDFLDGTPVGSLVKGILEFLAKDKREKFNLYMQKRQLTPEQLELIREKKPTELIDDLPHYFAHDLNAAMKADHTPQRLALFFDTHEAFWGVQRKWSKHLLFYQDEWLRRLLNDLKLSNGIVVVFAGRQKPRWKEAVLFPLPEENLDTQLVWHLSERYAAVYLQNAGISDVSDEPLRQAMIRYASAKKDQVHPFYLGLCADVVLTAREHDIPIQSDDFSDIPEISQKSRILTERLLKYVDEEMENAIEALSACRSFDFKLYKKLGKAHEFQATHGTFETLVRFSFVWEKEGEENRYRIHDLLRRFFDDNRHPTTLRTHAGLEKYYRGQGNVPEAIYHLICLDRRQGREKLITTFNQAKEQGNLRLCQSLLEIREEMSFYLDRSPRR
ncbi:hypothetical protein QUF72_18675 [Desulfobacterales bacterium HSG2]|nr:hypothetical protein [Desulfobacterales bacterium HSG2]